jgi:hypothetical protein
MSANLKLVGKVEQPTDITLALRAEIEARDWSKVMIEGDRRAPIELPERRKRMWRI